MGNLIDFIERELGVSRPTASKYLEQLTRASLVTKQRMGKTNFYINEPLFALLSGVTLEQP
jgi:DNA-binding transcriptional ArsR family regulator